MTTPANPFLERLEAAKAKVRAQQPTPAPAHQPEFSSFSSDAPDLGADAVSQERLELDSVLSSIDIIDAYVKWCGKMVPDPRGKRESIMISCPVPGHLDRKPSAWINLDKQTWFCGGCQEGGDKFTIASFRYGIRTDDRDKFPELKKLMAQDFGYSVKKTLGGQTFVEQSVSPGVQSRVESNPGGEAQSQEQGNGSQVPGLPVPSSDGVLDGGSDPAPVGNLATVTQLPTAQALQVEEVEEQVASYPTLDWKSIVKDDTFLGIWMNVYKEDDLPEEFYFWLGMMALGAAIGGHSYLRDEPKVRANLYVCLLGPSGMGKTRSIRAFKELVRKALPYDDNDPTSQGIKMVGTPGSAESLVDAFSKPVQDPADPKKTAFYAPVRGCVEFAELSSLTGRAERTGSVLKPTLMDLYDNNPEVSIRSRGLGITIAREPFAQTISTTQPRAIKELVTRADADSGFLNRWVFATGKPKPYIAIRDASLSPEPAIAPLQRVRSWCGNGRMVDWNSDALEEFGRWFKKTIIPIKNSDDPLLSRLELTVKKVLFLLAANEHEPNITLEHVEKMKIVFKYLEASFGFLGGHIGFGKFEDCRQTIERFLKTRSQDKPAKVSEITRMARTKSFGSDLIVKVLKTMVELGEVAEEVHKPQRGPTTQVYRWAE